MYFFNTYPVVPTVFLIPVASSPDRHVLGLCSKYPATALVIFLMTSRLLPGNTLEGSWLYVHPALAHSPMYIKSRHIPRPPIAMSAIESRSDRINAFTSAPGLALLSPRMISTNSGTGAGFIRFPPITGTSLGLRVSVDDVNVDVVDGAILPPLILPVVVILPLPIVLCDTTVMFGEAVGRFSNSA